MRPQLPESGRGPAKSLPRADLRACTQLCVQGEQRTGMQPLKDRTGSSWRSNAQQSLRRRASGDGEKFGKQICAESTALFAPFFPRVWRAIRAADGDASRRISSLLVQIESIIGLAAALGCGGRQDIEKTCLLQILCAAHQALPWLFVPDPGPVRTSPAGRRFESTGQSGARRSPRQLAAAGGGMFEKRSVAQTLCGEPTKLSPGFVRDAGPEREPPPGFRFASALRSDALQSPRRRPLAGSRTSEKAVARPCARELRGAFRAIQAAGGDAARGHLLGPDHIHDPEGLPATPGSCWPRGGRGSLFPGIFAAWGFCRCKGRHSRVCKC